MMMINNGVSLFLSLSDPGRHNKSTRMTTGKIGLVVVAVVLIFLLLVSRIKLGPEPSIAPAQRLSTLDQVAPASDQLCETVVHINSSSVDIPPSSWSK